MRGSGSSNGGKTGVYGGVLVRNMHGNLYLSMDIATESEVADTKGSTATATLLCSVTGIMLDDNNILPDHIIEYLTNLPDITLEKAYQLLDPADKQKFQKLSLYCKVYCS
jgi:hypothetical protein